MPKQPIRSESNKPVNLHVRIPSDLKNQIIDAAEAEGVSVNGWCMNALKSILVDGMKAPAPVAPVVTVESVVRGYVSGERVLAPCGAVWPCAGEGRVSELSGFRWCDECGIRLS